jgi:hypothetical protein
MKRINGNLGADVSKVAHVDFESVGDGCDAYDRLPPLVRLAIRELPIKIAIVPILEMWASALSQMGDSHAVWLEKSLADWVTKTGNEANRRIAAEMERMQDEYRKDFEARKRDRAACRNATGL